MKTSYREIVTILLVIIATVFAGCTDSAPSTPSVTTPQVTAALIKTTTVPAITTSRQPATTVQVKTTDNKVKIFYGDYTWVEYRKNISQTLPPGPRLQWEYNEKIERSSGNYMGFPVIHYKISTTDDYSESIRGTDSHIITKNGQITVSDYFYDTSTDRFFGGTTVDTIKGIVGPASDIPIYQHNREDSPWREMGIMPFGEMNITLAYIGTESVTVPAGTYPVARKYLGTFKDGTPITFWVAPDIPVPVQYQFPNKYLGGVNPFVSLELKGWG